VVDKDITAHCNVVFLSIASASSFFARGFSSFVFSVYGYLVCFFWGVNFVVCLSAIIVFCCGCFRDVNYVKD
jgi:hypothetical protein